MADDFNLDDFDEDAFFAEMDAAVGLSDDSLISTMLADQTSEFSVEGGASSVKRSVEENKRRLAETKREYVIFFSCSRGNLKFKSYMEEAIYLHSIIYFCFFYCNLICICY